MNTKKSEHLRAVAIDVLNGAVMIQKEAGETMVLQPKKHHKIEMYNADIQELDQGDMIRLTRNEGELKNGEVVKVMTIIGEKAILELKQGQDVSLHKVDLSRHKH